MRCNPVLMTLGVCLMPILGESAGRAQERLVVEAGATARQDTPVSFACDKFPGMGLALTEQADGATTTIACQADPLRPNHWWFVLPGLTPAGARREFAIAPAPAGTATIEARQDERAIGIYQGGKTVLQYHHAIVAAPEGQSPLFARSGFVHPLQSPSGAVLTAIQPPDHFHHLGLWMPWTRTKFRGQNVDFWNLKQGTGTVRFAGVESVWSGAVAGGFKTRHEHVAFNPDKTETIVLNETWEMVAWTPAAPGAAYWLVDLVSTQRCATPDPLILPKYHYGGLGFRGPATWKGNDRAMISEGQPVTADQGTRGRWIDLSGPTEKGWAGVAFLSHPGNPGHPEGLRVWPGDKKETFFCYTASQLGDWQLEPGRDYVFRYRLCLHDGKLDSDRIERMWADWATPPVATATGGK